MGGTAKGAGGTAQQQTPSATGKGGMGKGTGGTPQAQAPGVAPANGMAGTANGMSALTGLGPASPQAQQMQQQYQQYRDQRMATDPQFAAEVRSQMVKPGAPNRAQLQAASDAAMGYARPNMAPPDMAARQQMMDQYRTAMAGRAGLGGGIGSMMGNMAGMNKADFMPGGALAAPLDLADASPNPGGAPPANPSAAAAAEPAMAAEAMNRMQSQGMAGRPQGIAGFKGGGGRPGMGRFGGGKGGGGMSPYAAQYRQALMGAGRGQMNNGGIVGLATGGKVWEPVSRGGVSIAATTPAPVAAPITPAPAAAAQAAAPTVSWSPTAAPAAGGSMFGSASNVAPITQPAKFVAQPQQAIWQPPAKATGAEGGMADADFKKLMSARMMGNIMGWKVKPPDFSKMSDRQYIDYKMGGMGKGGGKGGFGNARRGRGGGSGSD